MKKSIPARWNRPHQNSGPTMRAFGPLCISKKNKPDMTRPNAPVIGLLARRK